MKKNKCEEKKARWLSEGDFQPVRPFTRLFAGTSESSGYVSAMGWDSMQLAIYDLTTKGLCCPLFYDDARQDSRSTGFPTPWGTFWGSSPGGT